MSNVNFLRAVVGHSVTEEYSNIIKRKSLFVFFDKALRFLEVLVGLAFFLFCIKAIFIWTGT